MTGRIRRGAISLLRQALDPTCRLLPSWISSRVMESWTSGMDVAICLHRVGSGCRPSDPLPNQTIAPETLDAFLAVARKSRRRGEGPGRLTLTFDDGYRDAVEYVASRAPLHPEVEWIVFVCPEKAVTRAAFRWDLWEADPLTCSLPIKLSAMQQDTHPALENRRPELRALGDLPAHALATAEQCRALQKLPNVSIGNHTNTHLALAKVDEEVARQELQASTGLFEELFGECRHFAFPFGVPHRDFGARDVNVLREVAPLAILWSAEQRPYKPAERFPGAVLPRVAASGAWSAKTLAIWLGILGRAETTGIRRAGYAPEQYPRSLGADSENRDSVAEAG